MTIENIQLRRLRAQRTDERRHTVECRRDGLSSKAVSESRERYGANLLSRKKQEGFFGQLIKSFNDPIIKILIGALVINALASFGRINWPESLGIVFAILIATLVSTVSEYTSSLAYSKLSGGQGSAKCTVRRGGKLTEILIGDLVVGDRVLLLSGMKIPADGIMNDGEIYCDQSALTGETKEIRKTGRDVACVRLDGITFDLSDENQVFSSSMIMRGSGEMTVLRVGDRTFMGEIAGSLQEAPRPSPLKLRLSDLAGTIGFMGYVGAFMIAFAYLFNSFFIDSGMDMVLVRERLSDTPFLISEILRAVTVAVSVVVVAVPEGLPMMITVVLSSNMKKMMRGGVLVRRLVGIETAGNLDILFSDKTGTLTTGKMSVVGAAGLEWERSDTQKNDIPNIKLIKRCVGAACTPASSATEKALAKYFKTDERPTDKIPFDSRYKFSAGLSADGTAFFAGAPEVILSMCRGAYSENGEILCHDCFFLREALEKQTKMSAESCRVLCLATGSKESFDKCRSSAADDLIFLALIAIKDPVRPDAVRCVRDCEAAGIQVVMVTGDNGETAKAIAREAGIITKEKDLLLSAEQLHKMTDDEVKSSLSRLAVVFRALPSDKLRLIRIAQSAGRVVGMTGDGVNDAPALKTCDVGFAMGSGTDIAKEAGDIVITDDSFASITRAVLYGRTIFKSIRKFIVFQLLMNLSAMGVSLIGPFIGIDSPVTVIQMLWVNIIMDTLGGLAFAGEPALRSYMLKKGPPRSEKLVSAHMLSQILLTGGYTLALGIFFLKSQWVKTVFGGDSLYHLTAFFAMFIFCGIFNSFNARTDQINILSHIAGNKPFIFIMTLVAAVQLLIIYFGGEVFRCTPLSPVHLLYCALFALTVIPADMIRKAIQKRKTKR